MRRTPKQKANAVLNTLHKGFVMTCIGVTLYATTYLGYRFYKYITVTRPEFIKQRTLAEKQLLSEGSSDNLKDLAPNIS